MARRVDRERSILGTELKEPKISRSGREGRGRGESIENVTHGLPWRLMETLDAWRLGPKKRLKRPGARLGCGGRDAENGSQSRSFLPPFHRYIGTCGLFFGKFFNFASTPSPFASISRETAHSPSLPLPPPSFLTRAGTSKERWPQSKRRECTGAPSRASRLIFGHASMKKHLPPLSVSLLLEKSSPIPGQHSQKCAHYRRRRCRRRCRRRQPAPSRSAFHPVIHHIPMIAITSEHPLGLRTPAVLLL
jgi:hypothetical protein